MEALNTYKTRGIAVCREADTVSSSPEGMQDKLPETSAPADRLAADDNALDGTPNSSTIDPESVYDDIVPDAETREPVPTGPSKSQESIQPSHSSVEPQPNRESKKAGQSWPLVRKFEALIFMAMFAAVPLFAVRVIQYTHDQLVVRNVSRELVKDLHRAKRLAVERQKEVEVSSTSTRSAKLYSYLVRIGEKVSEEVVLPDRVSVVGSIKFTKTGLPERASSFIVSSDNRTTTVEIDPTGLISVPN
jgi:hypothetical protein